MRGQPFRSLSQADRSELMEAFVYKGRTYYTFKDIFRMPTIRGLQTLDYYEEFNMRCTREYLTKFCDAMEKILSNTTKLELTRLGTLIVHMRERLAMMPVEEHVFKLASVVYFDDSENPFYYDRDYAVKKIALWKKDPEVLNFFLQKPLADLMPYSNSEKANLHSFSVVTDLINQLHMKEVLQYTSPKDMTVEM